MKKYFQLRICKNCDKQRMVDIEGYCSECNHIPRKEKTTKTLIFYHRGDRYEVNEQGHIKSNGLTYFSANWIFLGGSTHHWHNHIVVNLSEAFKHPEKLNGCLGWDTDFGTTRRWGGDRISGAHVCEIIKKRG